MKKIVSLVIREIQIKNRVGYYYCKKERELLYTEGRIEIGSHDGKQFGEVF